MASALNIFKRFDIRGAYPAEISESISKKIAISYYRAMKPNSVLIGHDSTLGGDTVENPFVETLANLGVKVYICGTITSPQSYFASNFYKIKDSVMITASHLGTKFTGFKFLQDGMPITEDELLVIKKVYQDLKENDHLSTNRHGQIIPINIEQDYLSQIFKFVNSDKPISKYKVICDASNTCVGHLAEALFEALEIDYEIINFNIEESYPSHDSNPKIELNRRDLKHAVLTKNADLGIIWDGDADRVIFMDSNGEIISPEFVAILIFRLLQKETGVNYMTADVRASNALETEVSKLRGHVTRIPAWHVNIKYEMENDHKIGFGIETSGHYVYRDFYKIDDGLLTAVLFIKAINKQKLSLSELLNEFRSEYYILEELNFDTKKNEEEIIAIIKKKYFYGKISLIDGISVDFDEARFNVRSSRTEPIIRLNISGTNKDLVTKLLQELKLLIE